MSNNGLVKLVVPEAPATLEQWGLGAGALFRFGKRFRWILGKYLVGGHDRWHDQIWQHVDYHEFDYSFEDIQNMMSVVRRIGDQYNPEVKWSFWQAMSPLTPEEREPIITRALSHTIKRDEIRQIVASKKNPAINPNTDPENALAGIETQEKTLLAEFAHAIQEVAAPLVAYERMKTPELKDRLRRELSVMLVAGERILAILKA